MTGTERWSPASISMRTKSSGSSSRRPAASGSAAVSQRGPITTSSTWPPAHRVVDALHEVDAGAHVDVHEHVILAEVRDERVVQATGVADASSRR